MTTKPSMRDQMPECAALIDSLRKAFGKEMIDAQIRKGMRGEPTFWATENGHEIGTRQVQTSAVMWDARGVSYEVAKGSEQCK
jgi:hypothetical protein